MLPESRHEESTDCTVSSWGQAKGMGWVRYEGSYLKPVDGCDFANFDQRHLENL
jgi:hypothetical protein